MSDDGILNSLATENKILKGKLRGFETLDKMFKEVKEKNKLLETEINQLKEYPAEIEEEPEKTSAVASENEIKRKTLMTAVSQEPNYQLPSPRHSVIENLSVSEELKSIINDNQSYFPNTTKLAAELQRLSESILGLENKKKQDQDLLKILSKELNKCKSDRDLFRRENEQLRKEMNELNPNGGNPWIHSDSEPFLNDSQKWKNLYFTARSKFDEDIKNLQLCLEKKSREIILMKDIISVRRVSQKADEIDVINQQLQIFQDDFKAEHQERLKAEAAKAELEKKLDSLQKEFQEKTASIPSLEKRLNLFIQKCEILTREKRLIKDELQFAQRNLIGATEFMPDLSLSEPKFEEAEKHQKRLTIISDVTGQSDIDEELNSSLSVWGCPVCTYRNRAWLYNCSVCNSRKPDNWQYRSLDAHCMDPDGV
ncbi:protein BCAP-like [Argonauta hians]